MKFTDTPVVNYDAPPDDDHGVALEHRFWILPQFQSSQQAAKLELAICDAGGLATGGIAGVKLRFWRKRALCPKVESQDEAASISDDRSIPGEPLAGTRWDIEMILEEKRARGCVVAPRGERHVCTLEDVCFDCAEGPARR